MLQRFVALKVVVANRPVSTYSFTNYPVLRNHLLAVYLPVNVLHHTLMRFHRKKGPKHPSLYYSLIYLLTNYPVLLTYLRAVYLPACSLVPSLLFKLLFFTFKPLPYMA